MLVCKRQKVKNHLALIIPVPQNRVINKTWLKYIRKHKASLPLQTYTVETGTGPSTPRVVCPGGSLPWPGSACRDFSDWCPAQHRCSCSPCPDHQCWLWPHRHSCEQDSDFMENTFNKCTAYKKIMISLFLIKIHSDIIINFTGFWVNFNNLYNHWNLMFIYNIKRIEGLLSELKKKLPTVLLFITFLMSSKFSINLTEESCLSRYRLWKLVYGWLTLPISWDRRPLIWAEHVPGRTAAST